MAIVGIQSVVQGVDDLPTCTRFFEDFGLPLVEKTSTQTIFKMEAGCTLVLLRRDDPNLPKAWYDGPGLRELVLGVDSEESLETLAQELSSDRELRSDLDGSVHFYADDGTAILLRVYRKKPLLSAPSPSNSPGNVNRLNQPRKWFTRARPKEISHVVLTCTDYVASSRFFLDRLGFRLSEHIFGMGAFIRADGNHEHHTIAFTQGKEAKFHHVCFTVDDIDELMAGANHMTRRGWTQKGIHVEAGLGRHRTASALFYYIKSPAGGEAEYGADTDYCDDNWIPRVWKGRFGYHSWTHDMPAFLQSEEAWHPKYWDVRFDPEGASLREKPNE